jgi:hypothetical protein
MCVKLVINKNYAEIHGQQNIKYSSLHLHSRVSIQFNIVCFLSPVRQ